MQRRRIQRRASGHSPGDGSYLPPGYSYPNVNLQYPGLSRHSQLPEGYSFPVFQSPSVVQPQATFQWSAGFPAGRPFPVAVVGLEAVESAAAKAYQNLVASRENVSACKVSQSALAALNVDSWNSLGFHPQDVPTFQRLFHMEGKVNAFIHCFACAQKITTLHELEVSLCHYEGVKRFEELGLGPFLRHPLVKHYFGVSEDTTEVFRITSEDIILSLQTFMSKFKKSFTVDEFLKFFAEQKSIPIKEKLGVRIQDMGFYLHHIREASKAEHNLLEKEIYEPNVQFGRIEEKISGSGPPNISSEKKILDKQFSYISSRVKNFTSICKVYDISDDSNEANEDDIYSDSECGKKDTSTKNYQTISDVKGCKPVSSCPYPSKTEEMTRLGLKPVDSHKTTPVSTCGINKEIKRPRRKKRRKLGSNSDAGSFCKVDRKVEVVESTSDYHICDFTLQNGDIDKFVATWKVISKERSVSEMLDMMLNYYIKDVKQRKRVKRVASSYPVIGMLNVSMLSMKHGMLGSIYDTFQALNDKELMVANSVATGEVIEVLPMVEVDERTTHLDSGSCVTVDYIIKKIINYFENYQLTPNKESWSPEKQFQAFKKLYDCEIWLIAQFNVHEFCSLGHGHFYDFLENHIKILPYGVHAVLSQLRFQASSVEVFLIQHQLGVMLSQADGNLMAKVGTTFDIFSLLNKQYPAACFCMSGTDPQNHFEGLMSQHKENANSCCVLFSSCLVGNQQNQNSLIKKEYSSQVQQCSLSRTSMDALTCLLNAPMLADLLFWSHWDLLYAPSLGPLQNFLFKKVNCKNLLCVATVNGKFVRVDHTATVDEFLEAFIQCSPFNIALKLLSLICLYRGINNAPLALLKCFVQKAVDVIIQNSTDFAETNSGGRNCLPGKIVLSINKFSESCEESKFSAGLCGVDNAIVTLSKTILECLILLPSEFRSFAAEIFLSGFRSVSKEAPIVILNQCCRADEQIMLHDIGLSLGVTEWVTDQHFSSTSSTDGVSVAPQTIKQFSNNSFLASVPEFSASGNQKNNLQKMGDDLVAGNDMYFSGAICLAPKMQAHCHSTRTSSINSEEQTLHDADAIVESIRHEEFGLNSNSNMTEDSLLKKQHARLGRALHCLSQELYSQDSHFILELVQNADDNIYVAGLEPELVFILQESGIIVLNNEVGFSTENIRALCDVGNSTKKGSSGYIGKKGIGFKSVFRVTDAPEIHSNGFHVKFDITEGQIGFILPTVIPPCDSHIYKHYLRSEDYQGKDIAWNTTILLPFRPQSKESTGVCSIMSMFSDLHPSLLLFLHRLRCIKFRNLLTDKLTVMRKETLQDGIVKISHGEEVMSFLVISKKLRSSIIRSDVESTDISLAFTLQESNCGVYEPILKNQPVFSFLPLRNYGLKFILQGDFVLPSSREEVDGDSAWNQWLLSEFPALFLSAEQSFCALPYFLKNHGKAVSIYMSFVPLAGEVHGFFSQLPQMLISLLRTSNCLLQDSPDLKWVLPCRVLRGWNEQARVLLSDNLLQKHIGLVYLHKDINLSDSLASTLGIRDFGPKVLVEVISSVCRSPENLESLGTDWLSAWFFTVYSLLNMNISRNLFLNDELEKDLIDDLRNIPLIPLTDGSYGFVADGPIWLPCNVLNKGSNDGYHPEDFPCLYSKLRIVTPQLFSETTKNAYSVEAIKADSVMQMLIKIGVQQLSAHEVIRSHILVAFSEELTPKDRDLMIEYLSFIMLHLQSDCVTCQSEKQEIITELQKLPVLVTSFGYKCPSKEPIHFGREYGNPVDVTVLFDSIDIEWIELDSSYLTHPSARSLLSGLTKWRSFFLDLGVTDFVQVICTDKKVEDFISDGAAEVGSFNSPTSFVKDWESPELVNLLSVFSSKKFRKKCIYLLEILDKMWDESYSAKTRSLIISNTDGSKKPVFSSFLKCINQFSWVASTLDRRLHQPKKLFYDCEQVCSVLGSTCPYAVPKVNSNVFARDLGFKMEVTIDDAVEILQLWRMSKVPFVASISQMLKFYTLLSSASKSSSSGIFKELISSSFIFIPCFTNSKSNHASGMFVSTKEVYWRDPTCCVDWIREEMLLHSSGHMENQILCHSLEIAYPTLHDFFVNVCGVSSTPPFCSYIQILQYLSIVALPSQAAHKVFQVLVRWANDIKLGLVTSDQIRELKEYVVKFENTVLPTEQDKWVSLHPSFGLICWPDDEELKKQFKHTDGVDFIQFGELNAEDKAVLSRCVATIFRIIGVPALSEIVFRKAIFNGKEDSGDKVSLVNWVLPYAQRYIHKLHLDRYLVLKQLGFEKISELQLVVVSKLFYKYTLQGRDSSSKRQFLCNCLLQDNILYVCSTSDVHSMFFELSRFFFNGTAELHLANFLHMVTTMAQSGSTDEQIEYFIVNSQRIPKLPENEPFWSISYACPETYDSIPDCPIDPKNGTSKSSQKKPGITSYWPPTDWKTAPGFENSQRTFLMNPSSYDCSPDHVTKKAGVTVEDPLCFGITGDWALEEGEVPESASVVQDSQLICTQSYTVGPSDSALEPTYYFEERDIPGRKTSSTNPVQLLIDQQLRRTGRLGEELAYQFFIQKHGPSEVQWVNEETETGKPYDLIVGEHEKTQYIEVKATRIASKDWFDITMSEWKFAAEKGDSYSIAHVSISESHKAKITVLRNPYNLCRRNVLSIALFMSKRGF